MQILADINQIELTIPIDNPGACYGDAFIAGIGAGIFSNLSEIDRWKQETKKIYPDPAAAEYYTDYYNLFIKTRMQIQDISHALTALKSKYSKAAS